MLGGVRSLLRRSPVYEPLRALRQRRAVEVEDDVIRSHPGLRAQIGDPAV